MYGNLLLKTRRFQLSFLKLIEHTISFITGRQSNFSYFFIKNVKKALKAAGIYPTRRIDSRNPQKVNCILPFIKMVINCDGNAVCGTQNFAPLIGDMNKADFRGVWNGPGLKDIRQAMLAGSESQCRDCTLYLDRRYNVTNGYKRAVVMNEPPEILLIEPTVNCNLNCPTPCGINFPRSAACRRNARVMPLNLFKKIIDGLKENIKNIGLFNYGEPFMHPQISEMIEYTRQKCPDTHLSASTNGMPLANEELLRKITYSGIDQLLFSVDGATQDTYEKYRRGGNLEAILKAMEKIIRLRKNNKPQVIWRYILFAWNDSDRELKEAERLAKDIGVDSFCFHLSDVPFFGSRKYTPGSDKLQDIAHLLYK